MKMANSTIISEQDTEYSSTLTKSDIGRHAVVANGCFFLMSDQESASKLASELTEISRQEKIRRSQ